MIDKEKAKEKIGLLVQKYNVILGSNKINTYDEERTKNELIEPLFEALGWDMRNQQTEDEVIKEQRVLRKKADYAFKLNGVIKFFVEAKALKEDLDNQEFAKQAISYGFNKGVTWAVLTDFEGLKVFNCEWEEQNIWRNQVFELKSSQYLTDFEKIWLLSKEGFEKNALADFAATIGKKIPRKNVAELILQKLLTWRKKLSSEIKKEHPNYSQEDIDETVQRFISRLIFIRACEDKEIEENMLREALNNFKNNGKSLSSELKKVFSHYRQYYDSKLFGVRSDDIHEADKIKIDNNVLAEVIDSLYYSEDGNVRYMFDVIPADILGNAYEQYLGTILKTTSKRAKLETGKAHRKEQGVYYTPTYIVDYIVKNTLGELLRNKNLKEIDKIKILDPACGSGSFLIKAFDVLDEYYAKHDKNYSQSKLGNDASKITRKIQIVKNNLFGVDLDEKAVEFAQLNLLLKMAEKRHLLPSLEKNIQCGDSLIDDPAIAEDKAFKWEEQFKEIMSCGGFDVVIGNPPYVDIKQLDPKIVRHFFDKYSTVENRMNLYAVFVERALSLLKDDGYFGFIIPNSILYNESYQKIRALLLDNVTLRKIIRLPDNVFQNVKVETIILIYQKKKETTKKPNCKVIIYPRDITINTINKENNVQVADFNQKIWETKNNVINISTNTVLIKLLNKIEEETKPFSDICDFSLGLTPYDKYKGHTKSQIEERVFHSKTRKNATFKPLLSGENITRYGVFWDGKEYISYGDWLGAPREQRFFTKPRIVVRQIISGKPSRIYVGYTEEEFYNTQIAFDILIKSETKISLKYLLAVLNSKLMNFYHKKKFLDPSKNLFQKILIVNAKKFPIKILSLEKQQPTIKLVDKMLSLNKRLNELGDKKTDERARLKAEITKTDQEIDELVYKIYGITEKEKKIIEENLK